MASQRSGTVLHEDQAVKVEVTGSGSQALATEEDRQSSRIGSIRSAHLRRKGGIGARSSKPRELWLLKVTARDR